MGNTGESLFFYKHTTIHTISHMAPTFYCQPFSPLSLSLEDKEVSELAKSGVNAIYQSIKC